MTLLADHKVFSSTKPQPLKMARSGLNLRRVSTIFVALVSMVFYAGLSRAEIWQQNVSARVSTEYETNPAMSAVKQESIWRAIVDPGYSVAGTLGTNELSAGTSLHIERSSNKTLRQDREDPRAFLNWKNSGETGEFGIATRYDEIATRSAEFDGLGLVYTDGTRASRNISANWKKSLNQLSTLEVNEAYTKTTFKGGTFTNYETQTGGVMYSFSWSESIAPFFRVSYDDYSSAVSGHSRRYSTMLGLNWKSSGQLEGSVQSGQSRGEGAGSNSSSQGVMTLQYTGNQASSSLNASRLVVASGLGGFATTELVNGRWSYEIDERNRTGVDLGWRKSHRITDAVNRTAGIWMQRDLNSFWGTRLSFQRRINGGDGVNTTASNILGISFSYSDPNF